MKDLSIIIPVLNEEESVLLFLGRVSPILDRLSLRYEFIFVDDGSTDNTAQILTEARHTRPEIRILRLSRNFGKEAALTAGLEAARGAAVVPMDVDLQDPPELIVDFVRLWRAGYDVVYGQRVNRTSDTSTKRSSAGLFYWLFNKVSDLTIEPNVGDFRLMNRAALDATILLRERNRFMKGIFAWVGFRSVGVPYSRPPRAAGMTKFNYWKLWNFALDGLTSFSTAPLRIWTYVGVVMTLGALIYAAVIVVQTLIHGRDMPGYASLMTVILMLGAIQLVSLGIIGEYLGRLYIESKHRPLYLVRESIGFEDTSTLPALQNEVTLAQSIAPRSNQGRKGS